MSVWAEAHDLPHVANAGKKIAYIPLLDYRVGRHADAFREEGALKIPVGYSRLDEILYVDPDDHSNDIGSVVFIYQRDVVGDDGRPNPVGAFVAERRPDDLTSRATSKTDISGRGLTSYFLDRMKLVAFDAPANPTSQGDWAFGGENLLGNPGLEESGVTSTVFELIITATGGSYTLSDGVDETSSLDFDAEAGVISNAIQNELALLPDVVVTAAGLSPRKFIITMVDPPYGVPLTIDPDSLTGGSGEVVATTPGGLSFAPWTNAKSLGGTAGGYTHFNVSSEQAHSGTYSLKMDPGPSTLTSNRWPGAQQIVSVTPGLAQASLWVYPTSGTDTYQMRILTIGEELIAYSANTTLTPNTWNLISIPNFMIPVGTTQAIFRIQCTNPGPSNPALFYIDDGLFYLGMPPSNLGTIWDLILASALTFLVPTFTTTLDSNGVAWDTERSLTLDEGESWGQIAEAFQLLWGYVHRIRYDREDNTYYFDIFNPGYVAFDHATTSSGSLIVGMNILEGETISRSPDGTHWHVKGADGIWVEDTDIALENAWGEAQVFIDASSVGNVDDLQAILDQAKITTNDQMVTFEAGMNNQSQVAPFRHIDIFHKISVELGARSSIPRGDRIVTSVVMSGKPGQHPKYQVFVNSDAFASTGAAALAEAVRRLLRKRYPFKENLPPSPLVGDKGGAMTIQLSAVDANEFSITKADFQLSGVGDGEAIMTYLTILSATGGELHLSEGEFNSGAVNIVVPAGVKFTGKGSKTHIVAAVEGWAVTGLEGSILMDFDCTNSVGSGVRLASICGGLEL